MTQKLKLDLALILPDAPHVADACVRRLLEEMSGKGGLEHVHVRTDEANQETQLCIHYDPDVLPLARIREFVEAAGAKLTARYGHLMWQLDDVLHQRKARSTQLSLYRLSGVFEVDVSATGLIKMEYDRHLSKEEDIQKALQSLGGQLVSGKVIAGSHREISRDKDTTHDQKSAGDEHEHDHGSESSTELLFLVMCGVLLGLGYFFEQVLPFSRWLPLLCYIASYFFGGFFTLKEAIENLRAKRFEIDTLMLVAAAGAATLGSWAEGALLLLLFGIGHALERYAMTRAKKAIEALAKLAPETATVVRNDQSTEIPVEELILGDVVIVRPNERLPADGFVIKGSSSVNQAPVTGESIPVDKQPVADRSLARANPEIVAANSRVFAGTINGLGAMEVEVTRRSNESALAKVVKLVSEAEASKSPSQRLTDKFERVFVPLVLVLAVLLLFAWTVVDEPFRDSFYRAMAVLVAASPCALAIATPSAVLAGIARAARGGVLIKGGAPLEELGSINAIAFDKTGTLTEGRPKITDVVPAEGITEEELLTIAVAVETLSDHPLAGAIARDGLERLTNRTIPSATGLESLTGKGVTATVWEKKVWIGKAEMFGSSEIPALSKSVLSVITQLREAGRTTMAVRHGNQDLGTIGLMDTPRAAARDALGKLKSLGIKRMIMLSGDHQKVADAVAKEVGLDEAVGGLMPEEKVQTIRKFRDEGKVAMVGDGVNDAPALANANVGIAMGAAGSDVALETADVALMADDLRHLPFAVGLSRHTLSIIRQNLFVSLSVVALLVPATVLGLGIGPAVAVHEGSTLIVVFNALRLLAYSKMS